MASGRELSAIQRAADGADKPALATEDEVTVIRRRSDPATKISTARAAALMLMQG